VGRESFVDDAKGFTSIMGKKKGLSAWKVWGKGKFLLPSKGRKEKGEGLDPRNVRGENRYSSAQKGKKVVPAGPRQNRKGEQS